MITEQHVPQFRFKDFSDSWEQRRLGDVAQSFEYGLNAAAMEYDGENKYLRITDIDDETHEFKTDALTTPDVDLAKADNYRLQDGDVLFARTGASVGKAYRYKASDGLVYFAGFLIRARIKPEYDTEFIFQSTLTDSYNRYVSITSQRSGQPGVNAQEYAEFELFVPKIDEQRQIGQLFKQLDRLLTLHQRKLELLKRLKQGYLQKLFPQNGENVPELRFKGYSDAWEKRKLGELAEFINGRAYKQDELLTSGKYPVLRVGNFYTNDKWYYSDLELPEKYYAEKGDLLYTWSATFGPHIWIGPKVIYHYHIWKVALKNLFEKDFALQFFEADRVRLLNSTNGSTMIHVTKKEMESKGILLPDISEQRNIGELLRKADDLIAATQHKVDLLKKLKQGYLQKMFC